MCVARCLLLQRVLVSSEGFSPHATRKYSLSAFFFSFTPSPPFSSSCPAVAAARPRRGISPISPRRASAVSADAPINLPPVIFARITTRIPPAPLPAGALRRGRRRGYPRASGISTTVLAFPFFPSSLSRRNFISTFPHAVTFAERCSWNAAFRPAV